MTPNELESSITLLRRAKEGDRSALEALYTRYLPRLSRWASGRISTGARHLQDTGDIVQDVMARFLNKMDDFTPQHDGALLAYLRTAILNRIRDASRYVARRPEQVGMDRAEEVEAGSPGLSPFEQCVARETSEQYEAALSRLSDDERAAVILRVELDYTTAEIADAMQRASVDATRMFVHRAILKLARGMRKAP